ncbi:MAG TPA: hypothetical protein VLX28_10725 [Thermoanaerobaculia bacterium]|nr:hypothetical protein [Thermoanaerobaculia bacterium]
MPITHPYVSPTDLLDLTANQRLNLLLLLEPRSAVYAMCGVLPRKRIALPPEYFQDALESIAPTFQVGPVLLAPGTPALPLPDVADYQWQWVHVGEATGQSDWSIELAKQAGTEMLLDKPAAAQEGWLRLKVDPEA